jgi:hypothetical protein
LSSNLEQASQAISEIEAEIAQRQQLVAQLEQQRQTAEGVSRLNKEQVEAVAQLLRGEVRANERQSFWLDVIIEVITSAAFFMLGLVFPTIVRTVKRILREKARVISPAAPIRTRFGSYKPLHQQSCMGQWHGSRFKVFQKLFAVGGFPAEGDRQVVFRLLLVKLFSLLLNMCSDQ